MDGVCCSRLLDVASVQSVSLVVDVSTSAVSLTDDSGCGLRADVSQLQTTLCLKSPSANSESSLLVHGQVTIIFVVSVGLSVCLFVCLFVRSFSQPSLIRFRSN